MKDSIKKDTRWSAPRSDEICWKPPPIAVDGSSCASAAEVRESVVSVAQVRA